MSEPQEIDPAFLPFVSVQADIRGHLCYRDLIPLRTAIEEVDTYDDVLHRRVTQQVDLFIKIILGTTQIGGHLIICCIRSIVPSDLSLLSPGAVGSVEVLTRCCFPEIRAVCPDTSTGFTLHCVDMTRGVRKINLQFFSSGHCNLFQFALEQLASPGACPFFPSSHSCIQQRIEYSRAVHSISFNDGPLGTLEGECGVGGWGTDERQIRVFHPFYNVQSVWTSKITLGLRDWLGDRERQKHFVHGVAGVDVHTTLSCRTAFHRTPIEAAIESALFGVGSWFPSDEDDTAGSSE